MDRYFEADTRVAQSPRPGHGARPSGGHTCGRSAISGVGAPIGWSKGKVRISGIFSCSINSPEEDFCCRTWSPGLGGGGGAGGLSGSSEVLVGANTLKVPPRGASGKVTRVPAAAAVGGALRRGGRPGAGRGWALKVGAHWLRAAAATSASRRLLCGSRTSRLAAARPAGGSLLAAVGAALAGFGTRAPARGAVRHGIRRWLGAPRSPPQVGARPARGCGWDRHWGAG